MSSSQGLLESPESSSPIVTRAVAAALEGKPTRSYSLAGWQRAALTLIGAFPQGLARCLIPRVDALNAVHPNRLVGLNADRLAKERLLDYSNLKGPFPCMVAGSALGGASAHLSLALGGPFLPQAFVVSINGGAPDGDVHVYLERSRLLALEIARGNPDLFTIQHYDPVHDEWMTRRLNHLRFKLLDIPPAYQQFILQNLQPGGTICYLNCQAQWLRYRLGERSVFQVGGWGNVSSHEYLQGSQRLDEYCERIGLHSKDWRLSDYPLEAGPESEWGSEPGLDIALQRFCDREGYQFVPITLPEPHDFSRLAFRAYQRLLEKENRQPAGVLVEMFSQFELEATKQAGLLPLWLVFNTLDSLAFLEQMLPSFPADKPIFFSPLSTFTLTPDLVPWKVWEKALAGREWVNIGTRPSHYPADARVLTDWSAPLHKWASAHRAPVNSHLTAEELLEITTQYL